MPAEFYQNKILKKIVKSGLFILIGLFFVFHLTSSISANPGTCQIHNISGFAWSSNAGWVSLSCKNVFASPEDYGLDIDTGNNTIYGWAWASTGDADGPPSACTGADCTGFGWICFGATCAGYGTPPGGGSSTATYNETTGAVSGWAKVIALGDDGWLKLRESDPDKANYGLTLNFDRTISGYAWNGYKAVGDSGPKIGLGWLRFDPVLNVPAPQCSDGIDNDSDNAIDLDDTCCSSLFDDTENNACPGGITIPWIRSLYKDIYTQGNIATDFLSPDFNATFMIFSDNSISNWRSRGPLEQTGTSQADWTKESVGLGFGFPQESGGVYSNSLGSIDFNGLKNIVSGNKNKYGQTVADFSTFNQNNPQFTKDIYYSSGPAAFTKEMNFNNNQGAHLFMIDGDFTISAATSIIIASLSNITELTSLAFIIRGDLIIDPGVSKVAGAFIVLGDGNPATCPSLSQGSLGCGRVSTGTTGDQILENSLEITGLLMARQFNLERKYLDPYKPAEEVIFDARILLNPPPGMIDLSKGLPIFRSSAP